MAYVPSHGCSKRPVSYSATAGRPPCVHANPYRFVYLMNSPPVSTFVLVAFRIPWPECIPQEIERRRGIFSFTVFIFAVDDSGLGRMQFQSTLCQSFMKRRFYGFGFFQRSAMHEAVIRISAPWKLGIFPLHPGIERVVQKKIR